MDYIWIISGSIVLVSHVRGIEVNLATDTEEEGGMEWRLILAYVFFAVGAVLIIFGFIRLIWWAWVVKKTGNRGRLGNPNFYTYYKDPWLRAPSMASLASVSASNQRRLETDGDSLQVDTDAIYAQPADATSGGGRVYIRRTSPNGGEQELSQTESQIYGEGSSSGRGHDRTDSSGHIYSMPHRTNRDNIPVTSIDEAEEDGSMAGLAPVLPKRGYANHRLGDNVSLTEVDRASMCEISYVEPPTDYSPEHHVGNHTSKVNPAYVSSQEDMADSQDYIQHIPAPNRAGDNSVFRSRSSELSLSGQNLYQTTVFVDRYGSQVSQNATTPGAGSVKSMKSLYQYMYADEPLGLDREMEYNFTSSYH